MRPTGKYPKSFFCWCYLRSFVGRRTQWIDRTTLRLSLRGVTDWAGRPVIDEDNRNSQPVEELYSAKTQHIPAKKFLVKNIHSLHRLFTSSSQALRKLFKGTSSEGLHMVFTSSSRECLQRVFTWSSREALQKLFTGSS